MILFFLFVFLYIIYIFKYEFPDHILYLLLCFFLFIICLLRNENNVFDYAGYKEIYNSILIGKTILIEPTFYLISIISGNYLTGISSLFFIYACLSLLPKFYLFKKLSYNPIQSLLLYSSNFFILHDLTQIRISVAIIFFLGLINIEIQNNKLKTIFLNLFGILFHYSFFIYTLSLPFRKFIISKWFYVSIVFFGYILYFFKISIFDFLIFFQSETVLTEKASQYNNSLENLQTNLFNPIFILRLIFFLIILKNYTFLITINRYFKIMFNYYFIGIICFIYFWKFPDFSGRFSEMFFILEIFLLPLLLSKIKYVYLRDLLVFAISILFLILNFAYFKLIKI